MRSIKNFILFIVTTTIAIANSQTTTNNLVTATCKQTPDPVLCQAALGSDPRISKANDAEALTLIMLDVAKNRFLKSLRYVEDDLTRNRKTHDPAETRALQECIRVYRVVVDTLIDVAERAIKEGDPKFGEEAMVDAGNEAQACKMAFPKRKVLRWITGRTWILHQLSNVTASLIKTLE